MLPPAESAALMTEPSHLPDRQFAGGLVIKQIFDESFALGEQPAKPLVRVAVANELVRCVLEVISCAYLQEASLSPHRRDCRADTIISRAGLLID
jgi:hypothetical protein